MGVREHVHLHEHREPLFRKLARLESRLRHGLQALLGRPDDVDE
jgi:hypothetical protein